ncbi:MAG: hypothetical protein KGH49_03025 [Candidatus Micrarchaeota archaeon]|nr:hypothetical protein [Candidatus Micrarchaeota archaeon]
MVKLYKGKNDKLILYVPFDVVESLKLKENDEVDFIKYNNAAFFFAKKSDLAELLTGKAREAPAPAATQSRQPATQDLSAEEVSVLKKLDSLRYGIRTKENVLKMLSSNEKTLLKGMIKKKAVTLFAKEKGKEPLFGISKPVYDRFLMRKGKQVETKVVPTTINMQKFRPSGPIENENVKLLESQGFVVLQSEAEASSLSLALEDSIRRGMVLGTRAFNRKFYIVLRSFFDLHGARILKILKNGSMKTDEVAVQAGIDEDGARALLYLLAESGDVTERRRDNFELA